jgi:hypothetical protein
MRYRYGFILAILLVACSDDKDLDRCSKACRDSGSTMKHYSYGSCECHNPVEIKFGTTK